jgi:hypothetical protein
MDDPRVRLADENPHGISYVDPCEGPHDAREAYIALSLANHGDGAATGGDRRAVRVETRCEGMRLTEQPVRDRPDLLGEMDLAVFSASYRADGHGRAAHDPALMVS